MKFVNPYFLIGLAAAALPVLIHLLTRDRIQKVAFSTLRFFAKASGRILRRKRFQEAILLAMRVMVCALLAIAFARPFLQDPAVAAAEGLAAKRVRVIVADVSGSIAARGAVQEMQAEAKRALDELSEGKDAAALITFAGAPNADVPPTTDFAAIRTGIDSLKPGHGATNIPEALRLADSILSQTHADTKEVVLISDLQRSGWQGIKADWKFPSNVTLTIKQVSGKVALPNLVIAEASCPESLVLDGLPRILAVKIANRSKQEAKDVPVTLTINGKPVATQKISLRGESAAAVRFSHVFDKPGDNAGLIHIGPPDDAADSSTVYFNARVIPRIQVVILNGSPSASPAMDGAFFLQKALAPVESSPFAVKSIRADQAKPEELKDAQVVILSNVGSVTSDIERSLFAVLQRGGGVLFLPGDNAAPEEFNSRFAAIAPCKLRKIVASEPQPGEVGGIAMGKVDFEHPVFEVFQRPHYGDFATAKFFRWWEVGDSQLARVSARFENGRPAVLERQVGRGISMMLASCTDLRWSNLALRAIYLPYLHQTVRYLAIRTEKRTAYHVGDTLPVPQGAKLKDPSGQMIESYKGPANSSGGGVQALLPGLYAMSGDGEFCYAVNAQATENDPATVSPEEIAAAIHRGPNEVGDEAAAADSPKAAQDRQNIWWYLVAAVLLLFTGELFLANKTVRH